MRATLLIAILTLTSSACYQFYAVDDNAPLPEAGMEVRVRLAPPQSLDLGTMTFRDVSTVEGHVRRSGADTLSVFTSQLKTLYGFRQFTNGAVFSFDRSQFGRLEQRKLVPWRTGVAIGVSTVGLAAAMYYAVGLGGGSEDGTPGGNDPVFGTTANIPFNLILPLLIP